MTKIDQQPWLAHYPDELPQTITYDEKGLHELLIDSAKRVDTTKALHFMGKEMSYADVFTESKKFAHYLQKLGLEKGDRVAIMLPNTPQAVVSYYGTLLAGGIVVQTNPLYTERELLYQMNDSGSEFIVCLDILLPRVSNVKDDTNLKHVIVAEIKDYLPFPKNLIYPFIQRRQYNMVVKVEADETTHVWREIIKHSPDTYESVPVDAKED